MKAKSINISALRFYYFPDEKTLVSSTPLGAYSSVCTPGPVVHGNFRDPNGWGYTAEDIRRSHGTHYARELTGAKRLQVWTGPLGDEVIGKPAWERTAVYNKCLEKLNDKVRGGLDLSIALAEAGTTARMIRAIGKVTDFARSKAWNTKALANGWLQWQYGWRPLLSDVYNVAQESVRIVERKLTRIRARATLPIRDTSIVKRSVNGTTTPFQRDGKGKQSCTIQIALNLNSGFDLARWTSLNPVSIGWELIPYSFVFDWFYDVGSWLRNLETGLLYGSVFNSGFKSELYAYDCHETVVPTFYVVLYDVRYWFGGCESDIRSRQFSRSILSSYPLPSKPTFNVDLSSQRLFSGAALLRQLLKR